MTILLLCRNKLKLIFLHYKWSNWFNCNLQRSTWHQIKCYYSGKFWNKHALSQNWHILFLSQCKVFNICPGSTRTNINFDIEPPFTKDSNSTPINQHSGCCVYLRYAGCCVHLHPVSICLSIKGTKSYLLERLPKVLVLVLVEGSRFFLSVPENMSGSLGIK